MVVTQLADTAVVIRTPKRKIFWQTFCAIFLCILFAIFLVSFFGIPYSTSQQSECRKVEVFDETCFLPNTKPCCPKKGDKKIIFMMLDSTQYRFMYDGVDENGNIKTSFPSMYETYGVPKKRYMYKNMADSPTLTVPQLKAMFVGYYTFLGESINNFEPVQVDIDTIMRKLEQNNFVSIVSGDDAFSKSVAGKITYDYATFSFNMYDHHFSDQMNYRAANYHLRNINIQNITPNVGEIKKYADVKYDWDLLFLYNVGIDHVSHSDGVLSPAMENKLAEVDRFIRLIMKNLEDDTILIVIGDHGCTNNGLHGGDTAIESESMLFVAMNDPNGDPKQSVKMSSQSTQQVDNCATLSSLFGVYTPFMNVGKLNLDIYLGAKTSLFTEKLTADQFKGLSPEQKINLLLTIKNLSHQIMTLLKDFSASPLIPTKSLIPVCNDLVEQFTNHINHTHRIFQKLEAEADCFNDLENVIQRQNELILRDAIKLSYVSNPL